MSAEGDARRQRLGAAAVERAAEIAAEAPPFSSEQIARLSALLRCREPVTDGSTDVRVRPDVA